MKNGGGEVKSQRNRTLSCDERELAELSGRLLTLSAPAAVGDIENNMIHQDIFEAAPRLPSGFVDMMFLDPPYNRTKNFNGGVFAEKKKGDYAAWFEKAVRAVRHVLKADASVYVCADWQTSVIIAPVLEKYFQVKNRITWERDKGRGAKFNWKNNAEDIWFCAVGGGYFFNVDSVKVKRKVLAPYRQNGVPKDWREEGGGNYRMTHPSNIWTDISVPFWSMPENTNHPTQKPEKLLAKLTLASTKPGGMVFDPFAGSGTAAVVAKKLRRRFVCVEINREYCCWGQKRLMQASAGGAIQGYVDGVFWERNSFQSRLQNGVRGQQQEAL